MSSMPQEKIQISRNELAEAEKELGGGQSTDTGLSVDDLAAVLGYITSIGQMASTPQPQEAPETPQEAPEAPKEEEVVEDTDAEQNAAIAEIDAELATIRSELESLKDEEYAEESKEDEGATV